MTFKIGDRVKFKNLIDGHIKNWNSDHNDVIHGKTKVHPSYHNTGAIIRGKYDNFRNEFYLVEFKDNDTSDPNSIVILGWQEKYLELMGPPNWRQRLTK